MFDNNYICQPKGIEFVAFFKKLTPKTNEYFTKLHYHDDFEVLYIKEGSCEIIIDGKKFVATKDTLVLINPFETHCAKALESSLCYYCLDFDVSFLDSEYFEPIKKRVKRYKNIVNDSYYLQLVDTACNAYVNTDPGWTLLVKSSLLHMFSKLENTLETCKSDNDSFVKNTLEYIESNLNNTITSKTCADEFGYDQSYFCRVFKKHFGMSFGEYLRAHRIEKAKSLLGFLSVTNVAQSCGFSCSSLFSQVFKKYTGISPSKYKKLLKGEKNDL